VHNITGRGLILYRRRLEPRTNFVRRGIAEVAGSVSRAVVFGNRGITMNAEKLEIFFVEDNEVIRFALKSMLRRIPGFSVAGEAANGRSALDELSRIHPAVILVDIGLPDIDGIELTKEIKKFRPAARVLMLTASDDESDIFDALDAGADGYVLKAEYGKNLETAIRSVRLGAVWLDPAIARQVLKATQRPLSKRQQKVEPIALSIEERTVLGHVAQASCQDGVCLVEPGFLKKLRRFANNPANQEADNQAHSQC
jgi:DNA-binding NarL/FixJ family response regulator